MVTRRGIRQRFKVSLGYRTWPQRTKKKEKEEEGQVVELNKNCGGGCLSSQEEKLKKGHPGVPSSLK